MNSLLNYPFPELCLCRKTKFSLPLSVSTRWLKQTGGTGRLPENWWLFSGQKKYSAFDKLMTVCVGFTICLLFVAGFSTVELQSPSPQLLVGSSIAGPFSRGGCPSSLPTVPASSVSVSLLTLFSSSWSVS